MGTKNTLTATWKKILKKAKIGAKDTSLEETCYGIPGEMAVY